MKSNHSKSNHSKPNRPRPSGRMLPSRSRGQSMVEYLVASAIAVAILAFPIDGHPSVVAMFLAAVRTAFARFLGAISLPM